MKKYRLRCACAGMISRGRVSCSCHAFTLIEVLVVVAIIALLLSILIPSLSRAREHTRRVACQSNMHQHLYAINMYAQDSKGNYPRNPSQHTKGNGASSWWIDTVVATYDGPYGSGGRDPFDLRLLLRRYIGKQLDVFSCPSNGGPKMDDPANLDYVAKNGYMGAQVMMFWNSVCVFKGTKPKNAAGPEIAWAPRPEWGQGGPASMVPLVQDEFNAIGTSVTDLTTFYYNHGYSTARSNLKDSPVYTNYRISGNRADCSGLNMGFLDGHVGWMRNAQLGVNRWTLDVPYSGSMNRVGGGLSSSGAPVTLPRQILSR